MPKESPAQTEPFRTHRGLLIGDTALKNIVEKPDDKWAEGLTGLEVPGEREWLIQVYREDGRKDGRVTRIMIQDVDYEKERVSFPSI